VAVLCTLSKIAFPLILAIGLVNICQRRALRRNLLKFGVRLFAFLAFNLCVIWAVKANVELVEATMLLDASYYHRFVGLYTISEEFDKFSVIGNSQAAVKSDAIFSDYEFRDDQRAFLDGSVLSKIFVDDGYVAAALYSVLVASLSASWLAVIALALAGLFINFLSLSPATILLFVLLCGMAPMPPPLTRNINRKRRRLTFFLRPTRPHARSRIAH
jgi:uncharacterized membrane protein YbhN (UPF0104 family)